MRTLVVVGHGMVGHRLVERRRSRGTGDTWRIVVFGAESRAADDRVALSSYFEGVGAEELSLVGPEVYTDGLVELRLGEQVEHVDPAAREVRTASGVTVG